MTLLSTEISQTNTTPLLGHKHCSTNSRLFSNPNGQTHVLDSLRPFENFCWPIKVHCLLCYNFRSLQAQSLICPTFVPLTMYRVRIGKSPVSDNLVPVSLTGVTMTTVMQLLRGHSAHICTQFLKFYTRISHLPRRQQEKHETATARCWPQKTPTCASKILRAFIDFQVFFIVSDFSNLVHTNKINCNVLVS